MVIENHLTDDPEEVGTQGKFSKTKNQSPNANGQTRVLDKI